MLIANAVNLYQLLNCQRTNIITSNFPQNLSLISIHQIYSHNLNKEACTLVGIEVIKRIMSIFTNRISSFSDNFNKIYEQKSAFWKFTWALLTCYHFHFKSSFLEREFVRSNGIHGGCYVFVYIIYKTESLQSLLPILFDTFFWPSTDVLQGLWITSSSSNMTDNNMAGSKSYSKTCIIKTKIDNL